MCLDRAVLALGVPLAALVAAACAGDDAAVGTDTLTRSDTTIASADQLETSTSPPRSDVPATLESLVGALGDDVDQCCEGDESRVEFTLAVGGTGSLVREEVDVHRPADARRGLDAHVFRSVEGGVFLTDGAAARFDCGSWRYTLNVGDGADLAAATSAVSAAAGCERVTVSAPTECLGLSDDPLACEDPRGHVPRDP
jgi:hypothetical protein